ncbi:putative DNA-binding pseudobarrel domain superfamily [Helianthus annuus]|nr:putative DNA-binding pseudobarrel domain superfamily [Helianthus annuus]
MESSSSIREPSFCRIMNRADELLMGVDKGPTNVLIETNDGRTFVVFISATSGKFFLFRGWSDVVTHFLLQTGALVILNPLDSSRFKLTYCLNGVIPECILPKSHDYTLTDLISTIYLCNKTFHVKIETVGGKACFTNGIDVIVSLYHLEAGCYYYFFFTKWFGYSFHLTIFGKNGVEMKFDDVHVDEVDVAPLNCIIDGTPISDDQPAVAEQEGGRYIRFVCTTAKYFRLPDDISAKAKLHLTLKNITIRLMHVSPPIEFTNGTRRETKEKGYGYALKRWSTFMNTAGIEILWRTITSLC